MSAPDRFAIFLPQPVSTPRRIILKGYASRYSRIDVAARAALYLRELSPGSILYVWLRSEGREKVLTIEPGRCPGAERSIVLDILKTLRDGSGQCVEAWLMTAEQLLHSESKERIIIRLIEKGMDLEEANIGSKPVLWVLGGHREPPESVEQTIKLYATASVSVGPRSYLTSHTIAFIAWWRSAMRV